MNILLTGATGLVGRALLQRLKRDGHHVFALVRSLPNARGALGQEAELVTVGKLNEIVGKSDAIINLAGEPIIGRWTQRKREAIEQSRVGFTKTIVQAIAKAPRKPRVLLSASAIGYYGDAGERLLDETSEPGSDFLARVCTAWEHAAFAAETQGVRTAVFRFGVVLSPDGGMLAKLLPVFRAGLGGQVGNGQQYQSFIHIDDLVELITTTLTDARYTGAVNAVAPHPITSQVFASVLSAALGRPAFFPVPAAILRLVFGQAASIMLGSQRVLPRVAERNGFQFRYPSLEDALRSFVEHERAIDIHVLGAQLPPTHAYLRNRQPHYELSARTVLNAPIEEVFAFFCRPENLGVITPSAMQFRITALPERLEAGARIRYSLRALGAPIRWQTLIAEWAQNAHFVDAQEKGPYRSWWHEHHFERDGNRTIMIDRVLYAPPFGALGRIVHRFIIASELRRIFAHRNDVIRRRFGQAEERTHERKAS